MNKGVFTFKCKNEDIIYLNFIIIEIILEQCAPSRVPSQCGISELFLVALVAVTTDLLGAEFAIYSGPSSEVASIRLFGADLAK